MASQQRIRLSLLDSMEEMSFFGFAFLLLVTSTSQALIEETVNVGRVKCGKVNFQCSMKITFKSDCSKVSRVLPRCRPKIDKCSKGTQVSFFTRNGCLVTGKYKTKGKRQHFSKPRIRAPVTPTTETTATVEKTKTTEKTTAATTTTLAPNYISSFYKENNSNDDYFHSATKKLAKV